MKSVKQTMLNLHVNLLPVADFIVYPFVTITRWNTRAHLLKV
jgi:hypothetical protein